MKLSSMLASPLLALAALAPSAFAQTFVYLFDGDRTNGIDGAITVVYDSPKSTRATITAALDFSHVDKHAIVASDGNCTGVDIVDYKWHVHVKWSSPYTSQKLAQCGKALTGNHYDPLRACGPFSEFIDTPACQAKIAKAPYACTPESYKKDPRACEKGDISGKLGDLRPNEHGLVHKQWVDEYYPTVGENTPEWNFILHAVCGKATPRVACAQGQVAAPLPKDWQYEEEGDDESGDYKDDDDKDDHWTTAPASTPKPEHTTMYGNEYEYEQGQDEDAYASNGQVGGY